MSSPSPVRGKDTAVERPLWLASASPRRRLMLEQAGIHVQVMAADVDDGRLKPGDVSPENWVASLAYLKARNVADKLQTASGGKTMRGTVIGADTVCVSDDQILGQPHDADDARRMLRWLCDAEHQTITGVCLLSLSSGERQMFVDRTIVRIGDVSDALIEHYMASGDWRGKAGAYNLSERIAAGWPIEVEGDPATVMGLPMRRLTTMLGRG